MLGYANFKYNYLIILRVMLPVLRRGTQCLIKRSFSVHYFCNFLATSLNWLFSNISSRNLGAVAASLSWVKGAGAELAAMPPALEQGWRGGPRPLHPHDPGPW